LTASIATYSDPEALCPYDYFHLSIQPVVEPAMMTEIRDNTVDVLTDSGRISLKLYLYILPALLLYLILMLYPLAQLFMLSFQEFSLGGSNQWVGLANYQNVLSDPVFWHAAQNTLVYGLVSILVPVILGLVIAAMLDVDIRGSTTVRSVIFTPQIVPIVVAGILFVWIFNNNGILNSVLIEVGIVNSEINWLSSSVLALPIVLMMVIWKRTGYYMVIVLAGLQSIPDEVYDAAKVQGKSRWQTFRHITVPMARSALVIVVVLGIINAVKSFASVFVMTEGGPGHATEILGTYFYKQTFAFFNYGEGAAIGFIQFAIVLVLTASFFYTVGEFDVN
jgi:ABC-type sugar transport system permease subunit